MVDGGLKYLSCFQPDDNKADSHIAHLRIYKTSVNTDSLRIQIKWSSVMEKGG